MRRRLLSSIAVRVLVTGGAGFIGSHIVRALLARGDEVAVVDDLSVGRAERVPADVPLHRADVRDASAVASVMRRWRPEAVCHQAAQTSVPRSFADPVHDADVNLRGGLVVLRAALAAGVGRFVHASSGGAVYGQVDAPQIAAVATHPPRPATPYGWSKLAFEGAAEVVARAHGLTPIALRYANVYGPGQDAQGEAGVVAIFGRACRRGDPVRVFGRVEAGDDGCVRDYVFVGDVVAANLAALDGRVDTACLDVGTGIGTTTRALASAVEAAAGLPLVTQLASPRPGDVGRSVVDGTRLRALLRATTSLSEGLARTVAQLDDA